MGDVPLSLRLRQGSPGCPGAQRMTALSPQGQKPVTFSAGRALPFPKRQVSRPLLERHQAGEVMASRSLPPTHTAPLSELF